MMKIVNDLNMDIEAFVKVNKGKRRGAGRPDGSGKHESKVPKKSGEESGELEVYFDNLPTSDLEVSFEISQIPDNGTVEGVKIVPGTNSGVPHHFEFLKNKKNYKAVIHYDVSGKSDKGRKAFLQHEDPTIKHPDDG